MSISWPFAEAQALAKHRGTKTPALFATGYGPSGLPHIGTFAEVVRTQMIRRAWSEIGGESTLYVFSDDMDGLRKVPDNIPRGEAMVEHLEKPLSSIPDPFGTHESFAAHNNARLCAFLDQFGFDYRFISATQMYRSGAYDEILIKALEQHDRIRDCVAATLGDERRQTYSPFLPICARTNRVLQAPVLSTNPAAGTLVYRDPHDGKEYETSVTSGQCKLQWKADWAMRWTAMGVEYEMAGKDLRDSVRTASKIVDLLGGKPPQTMIYELFLDEKGEKISKSRGNGLEVEQWLKYGTKESLSFFMYHAPHRAKRLYFDIIPKMSDEYLRALPGLEVVAGDDPYSNPAWHVHAGKPPPLLPRPAFSMLLNLASAAHAEDQEVLWGFLTRYDSRLKEGGDALLDTMVERAVRYYKDFVAPHKSYRLADEREGKALRALAKMLANMKEGEDGAVIQNHVYAIGTQYDFSPLKTWFSALYEVLLGQEQGPRMGSFIALYGIGRSHALIDDALAGKMIQKPANQEPANQEPADQKPTDQKPTDQKPTDQKPAKKS